MANPAFLNTAKASYDVLIIGAGISGITTALLLQKAGKNFLVLDEET